MNLTLLLPLGLAALVALAIPLLLHLNRRQQQRAVLFAAWRFVAAPARPQRRLRLEQGLLLLLRLLLLAAVALLLAQPHRQGYGGGAQDWAVVVPGVGAAAARARLQAPAAQWRWLLPDFPDLDAQAPRLDDARDVASLLRELDSELDPAVTLHVIVPGTVHGLDGGEIALSRKVEWLAVDVAPGVPVQAAPRTLQRISLRGQAPAETYLRAAVAAWNEGDAPRFRLERDDTTAAPAAGTAYVFLLAGEPDANLLRWVEEGGSLLLAKAAPADFLPLRQPDGEAALRWRALGRGRLVAFAAEPTPAQLPLLLDAQFPAVLLAALQAPPAPPGRATAAAIQPLAGAARSGAGLHELGSPLALLIAALVCAERLLSAFAARPRT